MFMAGLSSAFLPEGNSGVDPFAGEQFRVAMGMVL